MTCPIGDFKKINFMIQELGKYWAIPLFLIALSNTKEDSHLHLNNKSPTVFPSYLWIAAFPKAEGAVLFLNTKSGLNNAVANSKDIRQTKSLSKSRLCSLPFAEGRILHRLHILSHEPCPSFLHFSFEEDTLPHRMGK